MLEPVESNPMIATVDIPAQTVKAERSQKGSGKQARNGGNGLSSLKILPLIVICTLFGATTAEEAREQKGYQCMVPQGGLIVAASERQGYNPKI